MQRDSIVTFPQALADGECAARGSHGASRCRSGLGTFLRRRPARSVCRTLTKLLKRKVSRVGFEPTTPCLKGRFGSVGRSTRHNDFPCAARIRRSPPSPRCPPIFIRFHGRTGTKTGTGRTKRLASGVEPATTRLGRRNGGFLDRGGTRLAASACSGTHPTARNERNGNGTA